MSTKQERLRHANDLIRVIGSHGRRFFYNKERDTFARLDLRNGRVWWIDDYMGSEVFTHKTNFGNKWRGFSHGGTLRALVEDMRDYIMSGRTIERWKIVIQQLGADDLTGNIWGYDVEGAQAVRAAAYELPIVDAA
jgi:hypothetical protein